MLFINHATDTKAAKDYFTEHLSKSDYYMRDSQEIAGEWHGRGAELLGLSGTVDKENYFRLCENLNPLTGEQLTPRVKADWRVLYYFTFDAPKSVTLAYELGGDDRVMDAFRESVKETMGEMEDAMRVRVRKNGAREDRQTFNMLWGEFIHRTTRPVDGIPDPQLHCHAVAFNATFDPLEDRWKAGEFEHLVRDKGYYQAAFHSRLAEKLSSLGYGIERDGTSFKLAGIDRATTQEFSRRTALIKAEAKRLGVTNPKTLRELGRRTREAKPEIQMSKNPKHRGQRQHGALCRRQNGCGSNPRIFFKQADQSRHFTFRRTRKRRPKFTTAVAPTWQRFGRARNFRHDHRRRRRL
jgi:conjugative relaxase-like TrwC/TraI family protein